MMRELRRRVVDEQSLLDLMSRASREAVRLIDDAHWAGVTARFDGSPFTAAHTDDRVLVVDEGQYDEGDGPCLSSIREDREIAMVWDEVRERWPHLAETAEAAGVRSFLAEPLHAQETAVGSLNLYSGREGGLRTPDPDLLTVLTEYLDRGLADYSAPQTGEAEALRLRQQLAYRHTIDTAVGMVMARDGIDAAAAARRLDAEAQRRDVPVRRVAMEILGVHPGPDAQAPPTT